MTPRFLLLLLLVAGLAAACSPEEPPAAQEGWTLPEDPKVVVLSLDEAGGFTSPRMNDAPRFSFLADGTLRAPDLYGRGRDATARLAPDELHQLLAYVVEDEKVFSIDPKALAREIQRRGPGIVDASTTVLEIRTRERSASFRVYALRFTARRNPDVADLQRLARVADRIEGAAAAALAGGRERAGQLVAEANRRLREANADAPPFALESLRYAITMQDGTRRFALHAPWPPPQTSGGRWARAQISLPPAPPQGPAPPPEIEVASGP